MNTMTWPRATLTPLRTAAPFPKFQGSRITLALGSPSRHCCATAAVSSVLPSSTRTSS